MKPIKSKSELQKALVEIERLVVLDPEVDSKEGETLKIYSLLVEDYEKNISRNFQPDPIDAIVFRMEQQNLSQRDLVAFIGSRSKVSEVLSRKRPLTLSMIRALHNGLGIPAESLIQDQNITKSTSYTIEWERFPIKEMASRGWLKPFTRGTKDNIEAVKKFFDDLSPVPIVQVLYRSSNHTRSARKMDQYALAAWTAKIIKTAFDTPPKGFYEKGKIDRDFMKAIVRLSVFNDGPMLACRYLADQGVSVVIEKQLPNTYLDGSAIMINKDRPIIALTLRYDRIDNFWFTLVHELAHLHLHLDSEIEQFYDDFDVDYQGDLRENEADTFASDILIPNDIWKKSPASKLKKPDAVINLSKTLGIHPAIVAGRIRHETKDFRILNNLVGHKQIRNIFGIKEWK
jgi:HTH-type transcriptional regulator / antitoxin HigA